MPEVLLDTSVLLKWFHRDGEGEIEQAEWHLQAHRQGVIQARILDLGVYELGNVALRALNRTAEQAVIIIETALALCGPPLTLGSDDLAKAASIAQADGLTFYDAAFAAGALAHGCTLISADRRLLAAGHAISLDESIERLRGLHQ